MGNAYVCLKQYENAISFYKKSLEIQLKTDGNGKDKAGLLDNLGLAYYSIEQYQEAISFYKQSIEVKHKVGDKQGEAKSFENLANTYYRIGKAKEGLSASSKAYEILQELEVPLESRGYPNWLVLIIRFTQRGKWHSFLCFCIALFTFPLILAFFIALDLWQLLRFFTKR